MKSLISKIACVLIAAIMIVPVGLVTDSLPISESSECTQNEISGTLQGDNESLEHPDLCVASSDVSLVPKQPRNGEATRISVLARNLGGADCIADLAVFDSRSAGTSLIGTQRVAVRSGSLASNDFVWIPKTGTSTLQFVLGNCDPIDDNDSNNRASLNVTVLPMREVVATSDGMKVISAGDTAVHFVSVQNKGDIEEQLEVELSGIPRNWHVRPSTWILTVEPGEVVSLSLSIRPPEGMLVQSSATVSVTLFSEDGIVRAEADITTVVDGQSSLRMLSHGDITSGDSDLRIPSSFAQSRGLAVSKSGLGPMVVRGFIVNSLLEPVAGANVTVKLVDGETTVMTQWIDASENDGLYSVTFGSDEWNIGETIEVSATFGSLFGRNSKTAEYPVLWVNVSISSFRNHIPIRINNDAEFASLASSEAWLGDGSIDNPWVIEGYSIDATGYADALYIGGTTRFFEIRDCRFENATWRGISIYSLAGALEIYNVTCNRNGGEGIAVVSQSLPEIQNCRSSGNLEGIVLYGTGNVNITNCVFDYNSLTGIRVESSSGNTISDCEILGNSLGILIAGAYTQTKTVVRNCLICDNIGFGVEIGGYGSSGTFGNSIYNNTFIHNNGSGDTYDPSHIQATDSGDDQSWWNDSGVQQGYGNYWADWRYPDSNRDGIVDAPYIIAGSAGSTDYYPLTASAEADDGGQGGMPVDAWIIGRVTDGTNPVPATYVMTFMSISNGLETDSSFTDTNGYYFIGVRGGFDYFVYAFEGGHYSSMKIISIQTGETQYVNFSLQTTMPLIPDVTLKGYIRDELGNPATAGHVLGYVVDPVDGYTPTYGNITTPDASGYFQVNVLPSVAGGGVVAPDIAGYEMTSNQSSNPLLSGQTYWFNLTLASRESTDDAMLRGTVTDSDSGMPLENVLVSIESTNVWNQNRGYSNYTLTDALGHYEMDVTNGTSTMTYSKVGYSTYRVENVQIDPNDKITIDVQLKQAVATIRGNVTDAGTGLPIANARVYLTDTMNSFTMAYTNSSGAYVLDAFAGTGMALLAEADGYARAIFILNASPAEMIWRDFGLQHVDAWMTGRITDAITGAPIEQASVYVYKSDYDAWTQTNATGYYSLSALVSGNYSISINAMNYRYFSDQVEVLPGGNVFDIQLTPWHIPDSCLLWGYVNDSTTMVGLSWGLLEVGLGPPDNGEHNLTQVNGTGYYEMWIPPISLMYMVAAGGYVHQEGRIDATGMTDLRLDFALDLDPYSPNMTYSQSPLENVSWFNPSVYNISIQEQDPYMFALYQFMFLNRSMGLDNYYLIAMYYDNFNPFSSPENSLPYSSSGDNYTIIFSWDAKANAGWLENGVTQQYFGSYELWIGPQQYEAMRVYYTNSTLGSSWFMGTAYFDSNTCDFAFFQFDGNGTYADASDPTGRISPAVHMLEVDPIGYALNWDSDAMMGNWSIVGLKFLKDQIVPSGQWLSVLSVTDFGGHGNGTMKFFTVDNDIPVAEAGLDQVADVGDFVWFDGRESNDNVGIMSYTWTVNDSGQQVLFGATPCYIFRAPGVHLITLTVKDAAGNSDTDSVTITVRWPPVIEWYLPSASEVTLFEGESLPMYVNATDPQGDALFYCWILDGEPCGDSPWFNLSTAYGDRGLHFIQFYVGHNIWNGSSFIPLLEWTITVLPSNPLTIESVIFTPDSPNASFPVTVHALVSSVGTINASLNYTFDGEWHSVQMDYNLGIWVAQIPSPGRSSWVEFYVYAQDSFGRWNSSDSLFYYADGSKPNILSITRVPAHVSVNDTVSITANAEDDCLLGDGLLWYDLGDGWNCVQMSFTGNDIVGTYSGTIPSTGAPAAVTYWVELFDSRGNLLNITASSYTTTWPPVTSLLESAPSYHEDGYVFVAANASLMFSVAGTGPFLTYYSVDSSPWQTYTTSFSLGGYGDGIHNIEYYSVDALGIAESPQLVQILLSTSPPSIRVSGLWDGMLALNSLTFDVDTASACGIDMVQYWIDSTTLMVLDAPDYALTLNSSTLTLGLHTIGVAVRDNLGYVSIVSMQFVLGNLTILPAEPDDRDKVSISMTLPSGLVSCMNIGVLLGTQWVSVPMVDITVSGLTFFNASLGPFAPFENFTYRFSSLEYKSSNRSLIVANSDVYPPQFVTIKTDPTVPDAWDAITVSVTVIDGSGVSPSSVVIEYSIDGGSTYTARLVSHTVGSLYRVKLNPLGNESLPVVLATVFADDVYGNSGQKSFYFFINSNREYLAFNRGSPLLDGQLTPDDNWQIVGLTGDEYAAEGNMTHYLGDARINVSFAWDGDYVYWFLSTNTSSMDIDEVVLCFDTEGDGMLSSNVDMAMRVSNLSGVAIAESLIWNGTWSSNRLETVYGSFDNQHVLEGRINRAQIKLSEFNRTRIALYVRGSADGSTVLYAFPSPTSNRQYPLSESELGSFFGEGNSSAPRLWTDAVFTDLLTISTASPQSAVFSVGEQINFAFSVRDVAGRYLTSFSQVASQLHCPNGETIPVPLSVEGGELRGIESIPFDASRGIWWYNLSVVDMAANSGTLSTMMYFGDPYIISPGIDQAYLFGTEATFSAFVSRLGAPSNYLNSSVVSLTLTILNETGSIMDRIPMEPYVIDGKPRFRASYNTTSLGLGVFNATISAQDALGHHVNETRTFRTLEDFFIEVSTDKNAYERGEHVLISGAVKPASRLVSNCTIILRIDCGGFMRSYYLNTTDNGSFSISFVPLSREAGIYVLSASVAILGIQRMANATFSIDGLYLSPAAIEIDLPENSSKTIVLSIKNVGNSTISGLACAVFDPNPDDDLTALAIIPSGSLLALTSIPMTVSVSAGSSIIQCSITISVYYSGGHEECLLNVTVHVGLPCATVSPQYLDVSLNPGETARRTVEIHNSGYGSLHAVSVSQPVQPWILTNRSEIGDIGSGESEYLDIWILPSNITSPSIYYDEIRVSSLNYPTVVVYLDITITNSKQGSVAVHVVDDFGASIANATIELVNCDVWTLSYSLRTDQTGSCSISPIPVGLYTYFASAEAHDSSSGQIEVRPEFVTPLDIELIVELVSVEFGTMPVLIHDRYFVTMTLTFETDVPIPTMVPVPSFLEFNVKRDVAFVDGFVGSKNIRIFNTGGAAIEDVNIEIAGGDYQLSSIVDTIDEIQAQSYVDLPIKLAIAPKTLISDASLTVRLHGFFYVYDNASGAWHVRDLWIEIPVFVRSIGSEILFEPSVIFSVEGFELSDFISMPIGTLPTIRATNTATYDHAQFLRVSLGATFDVDFGDPLLLARLLLGGIPPVGITFFCGVLTRDTGSDFIDETYVSQISGEINRTLGQDASLIIDPWDFLSPLNGVEMFLRALWESIRQEGWNRTIDLAPGETLRTDYIGISLSLDLEKGTVDADPGLRLPLPSVSIGGVLFLYIWDLGAQWSIHLVPILTIDLGLFALLFTPDDGGGWGGGGYGGGGDRPIIPPFKRGPDLTRPPVWQETVHERVKIEISQTASFEREAFEARLTIRNKMALADLANVSVRLEIVDPNGTVVNDLFYVGLRPMEGISDVNGSGTIAAQSLAKVAWLIVPKSGAGGLHGNRYYIRALISYSVSDANYSIITMDEPFDVAPLPRLVLDYYVPRTVTANQSFKLSVRVTNIGNGTVKDFNIESAQPVIVENIAKVPISFSILDSHVQGDAASPQLTLHFGDIPPGETRIGYWDMLCTLTGNFTEFVAVFGHSDEYGGAETSLLASVRTSILMREINAEEPNEFLIDADGDGIPEEIVSSSSGEEIPITIAPNSVLELPTPDNENLTIEVNKTTGWMFTQVNDVFNGTRIIDAILRNGSDPLDPMNYWISEGNIDFVDDPAQTYVVVYGENETSENTPPLADFSCDPYVGYNSTLFIFNANSSRDMEDSIDELEFRWDWEDDGVWDTEWSLEEVISHRFAISGSYSVKVGVRDTDRLTNETTKTITVLEEGNVSGQFRIMGYVFLDRYSPGVMGHKETEEGGLGNWIVTLEGWTLSGSWMAMVTYSDNIDDIGYYEIDIVPTGTYSVNLTSLAGYYYSSRLSRDVTIEPTDPAEMGIQIDFGVIVPSADPQMPFILREGWNLWSCPMNVDGLTAKSLLNAIGTTGLIVVKHDKILDKYVSYVAGDPDKFDFPVVIGEGYYVWARDPTYFTLKGALPSSSSTQLSAGWNLIGYSSMHPMMASELLTKVKGGYALLVVSLDPNTGKYESYVTGDPAKFDFTISPGRAYYIWVDSVSTLEFG